MPSELKIIHMAEDHLNTITQLELECFSSPWSYCSLKSQITKDGGVSFVALNSNAVCGYISMQCILDECYINHLAVFSANRRQGIGKELLKTALKMAEEKGLNFISLEVRISNTTAINLYESQGFCIIGQRKDFYSKPREDAFIMTKYFNTNFNLKSI